MKKQKKLLALIVAINKYAVPDHNLNGCRNDATALLEYLQEHGKETGYAVDACVLTDSQATRKALIENFLSHFGQLEKGDTGLFYFSGHGSKAAAPKEFWHDVVDQSHETLVCHDSRLAGERDLYDKELGYLIWKATDGKDVHFTAILDCCHAGSGSRKPTDRSAEADQGIRMTSPAFLLLEPSHYLGRAEYRKVGDQLYVPLGKHLVLSACRSDEEAKERLLQLKPRGVFTYSLLETLQQNREAMTYGELLRRVQAKVYNNAFDQHPQMEAYGIEDAGQLYFLGGSNRTSQRSFVVTHHPVHGWVYNQGSLHGLAAVNPSQPPTIKLWNLPSDQTDVAEWTERKLLDVHPNFSTVDMPAGVDAKRQFTALPGQLSLPQSRIEYSPDGDAFVLAQFQKEWEAASSCYLQKTGGGEQAHLKLRALKNRYEFVDKRLRQSFALPFEPQRQGESAANQLMKNLETMARWHQIRSMNNPFSRLSKNSIRWRFFEVLQTSADFRVATEKKEWTQFGQFPPQLAYRLSSTRGSAATNGTEPAFQLQIANPPTNHRPLWLSLLYLGNDYSITNELLPLKSLEPGQQCWLESFEHSYPSKVIALHLPDELRDKGIRSIKEHFKLLISTDEFNTYSLNQKGLDLKLRMLHGCRGLYRKSRTRSLDKEDWYAMDFCVEVMR